MTDDGSIGEDAPEDEPETDIILTWGNKQKFFPSKKKIENIETKKHKTYHKCKRI